MNNLSWKERFKQKATEQGCVAEAVCLHKNKSFWSEMLWDCKWLKTFTLEVMYSYTVNEKPYFKYLNFRVSKKTNLPRNPYKIRIYYSKRNPWHSYWEPIEEY